MKVLALGATPVRSGHTPVTRTLYSQNLVDEAWGRGRDHGRTWKPGIVEYTRIYEASWHQLTERLEKIRTEHRRLLSTPTLTVMPWNIERLQQVTRDQEQKPNEYNEVFVNFSIEPTHSRKSTSVRQNLNSIEISTENKTESCVTNNITSLVEQMESEVENGRIVHKVANDARARRTRRIATPQRNKYCQRCGETVYPTENIEPNRGATFHHSCFRCSHCNTKLTLQSFFTTNGNVYCRAHVPKPSDDVNDPNRSPEGKEKIFLEILQRRNN
ncbi:LIM domain and actin-binding protein 1-like isoform X2 [Limulus polyphemus]|uniref:LIM domain and actin-binding protein 1-like isoform X2 n=1 Tax=Limulus polyphemus TaxID=6850 RepID=A0ABM1SYK1_LIMPO|nr:LIM domain and actin-binding protein 1-like isoform X2 [Limulus polyphemus]